MTKATFNPFLEDLSGSYGGIVFRHKGSQVILAHKPNFRGYVPSPAQLAQRERFRLAALYGKAVLSIPAQRQPYQQVADRTGKTVMGLLVSDYLVSPVIDSLDLAGYTGKVGEKLIIHAHDDFEITSLQVRLVNNGGGSEIEKGPASEEPAGSGCWVYSAKTAVTPGIQVQVVVTASDRPGNRADQQALKTV